MAIRNVGRNWNRTGMIILGMMAASALMTLTLAFASGYPDVVHLSYRRMVGADILVYPNRFIFSGPAGSDVWERRALAPDHPTDALFFHPELASGYLSPASAPPPLFDTSELPAALLGLSGVGRVEPARLMRAYLVVEEGPGREPGRVPVIVRGRDIELDRSYWDIPSIVTHGRYFNETQEQAWVALANSRGLGVRLRPGERLVLEVPLVRGFATDGSPVLDHTDPRTYYFLVYGVFDLSLGDVPLQGLEDQDLVGPPPRVSVGIDSPEVWIPSGTFDLIYEEVSGGPFRYCAQLGVLVESMFHAKAVAAALAEALPDCSVLTVPQEVGLSGLTYVAAFDPSTGGVKVTRIQNSRPVAAVDIKAELAVLAFVVAGLLVVANMFILVSQRRREIGILKAVGASSRDIFVLILTESLGYSLVGSLIGFTAVRLVTLLGLAFSSVTLLEGALLTLGSAALVIGLTVGTALVFGFVPAWAAARTPSVTLLSSS
jgi:hypothetical protein